MWSVAAVSDQAAKGSSGQLEGCERLGRAMTERSRTASVRATGGRPGPSWVALLPGLARRARLQLEAHGEALRAAHEARLQHLERAAHLDGLDALGELAPEDAQVHAR